MTKHLLLLPLAGVALFAAADVPAGEAKLARLTAGRTAGTPRDCLSLNPYVRSTTVEQVGVVYDVGTTRYVSRFEGGCPQLRAFTIIVTQTPTTQLCRGDIAQLVGQTPPNLPVGSCTYGAFVPYARDRRPSP